MIYPRPMRPLTRLVVAASAVLVIPLVLAAQTGRPMSIGDLIGAVRVADPQVSPAGDSVAYVRTTTDVATGKRNADVWIVPADGSAAPKILLAGEKTENTPRWSPDGRQLAFISTRDGDAQVYLASADGTNIRRVTNVSGGVQPPLVFSHDGSTLAFVADVYPECADDACNRQKRDAADKDPVKVHVMTRLLYRHWDEWREDVRHHVFVVPAAGGTARDLTPGDFDSPPGQQEDNAIAFSPDNTSIAFVSNREGNDKEAWTTNNDVWLVSVSGGTARKITANPAADDQPVFTPDGKSMIVRAQRRPGFESDRFYLDVYDLAAGTKRTLFETPDLSVSDYVLDADSQAIYFTATSQGTDNLYRVGLSGGGPTEIVHGGAIGSPSIGKRRIAFSRSTMTAPADLWSVARDGGANAARVQLTHENDGWLRTVAFTAPESHTVAGAAGASVQYLDRQAAKLRRVEEVPVVFLIHGGPQGDWGDGWSSRWNPALWAAQGWVVAAPNPRGSTGFGQKFVDDISEDWGGKVMGDLTAVFDDVVKLPYVDSARQGIAGASYGGYAVDWLIGHTTRFKAAVTHDGVFNMESMSLATEELWFSEWEAGGAATTPAARANFAKWSPHLFAQNIKTPTLVITNEQDFRVPVDQGLQLFTALRRNGVPSEMLSFPDEGHWVLKALNSQRWHEMVFGWMKKYLGS